jgi:hypothetical protein
MKLTEENRSNRRKTCPSATSSTTKPTWTDPGSNLGLRGERSSTNRLSHGTAWLIVKNGVITHGMENIKNHTHTYRNTPRQLSQVVRFATYIQEISRSHLGRNTDCFEDLMFFLSLSKQMAEQYSKLGHGRFFADPFQLLTPNI